MKQKLCECLACISVVPSRYVCERLKNEHFVGYVNMGLIAYLNPWKSNPVALEEMTFHSEVIKSQES